MARKWWTLTPVSLATFMLLLDVTLVKVALPAIGDDLGTGLTDPQWVVDSYVLALAALTLMAGSLADRVGRKLQARRAGGQRRLARFGGARFRPGGHRGLM
jgi:MFS family permease